MHKEKGGRQSPFKNTITYYIQIVIHVNAGSASPLLNKGLIGTYEDGYADDNGGVGDG